MKSAKYILLGSLLLNAALAAVFFSRGNFEQSSTAQNMAASTEKPSTPAAKWLQLAKETAGNDAAFVARLRAEGFPPAVIRAIVRSNVQERYASRRNELQSSSDEYAYWKSWSSVRSSNPDARAALRKLEREQFDLLRQLLGDDEIFPGEKARRANRYGNLSNDNIQQLELITRDYEELMQKVHTEARGLLFPEDKEKLAFLRKEQKADIEALLTPDEIGAYERRSSNTAQLLKARIQLFDATEQEYLAIYRLQKTYDDKFNPNDSFFTSAESVLSREESKARSDAQGQLAKDIEAAVGPERYKEYKITTDYEYRRLLQLTERLSLPDTTAKSVVSIKYDTEERSKAIRTNRSLDKQQIETQLAALAQEVTEKLTRQLGTEGFNAYRDSSGRWVKNLSTTRTTITPTR